MGRTQRWVSKVARAQLRPQRGVETDGEWEADAAFCRVWIARAAAAGLEAMGTVSPVAGRIKLPSNEQHPRNPGEYLASTGLIRLAGWDYEPRVCVRCRARQGAYCIPPRPGGSGPLTPLADLRRYIEELDRLYPSNHVWCSLQEAYLQELEGQGVEVTRLLYAGYTEYSPLGREQGDQESLDSAQTLLATWRRVTGQTFQIFHWAQLDQRSEEVLAFRTDPRISGVKEVLVDLLEGPQLSLNQQPGGFVRRFVYHLSLVAVNTKILFSLSSSRHEAYAYRRRHIASSGKDASTEKNTSLLRALLVTQPARWPPRPPLLTVPDEPYRSTDVDPIVWTR